eukprot:3689349-Alexandrium_andersonii.AAC.1
MGLGLPPPAVGLELQEGPDGEEDALGEERVAVHPLPNPNVQEDRHEVAEQVLPAQHRHHLGADPHEQLTDSLHEDAGTEE